MQNVGNLTGSAMVTRVVTELVTELVAAGGHRGTVVDVARPLTCDDMTQGGRARHEPDAQSRSSNPATPTQVMSADIETAEPSSGVRSFGFTPPPCTGAPPAKGLLLFGYPA